MDIYLNVDNLPRQLNNMYNLLEYDEPTRIDFWDRDKHVARADLSLSLSDEIEIRWIVVDESERKKGYLKVIIKGMSSLNRNIIGEITDIDLRYVWSRLGADFINDWEWIIRPSNTIKKF